MHFPRTVTLYLPALVQLASSLPHSELSSLKRACNDRLPDGSAQVSREYVPPPVQASSVLPRFDSQHAFVAPASTDQRGPCPALNTLADYGYLPHSGIAKSEDIIAAVSQVYTMDISFASFLVSYSTLARGNPNIALLSIGSIDTRIPPIPGCVGGTLASGLAGDGTTGALKLADFFQNQIIPPIFRREPAKADVPARERDYSGPGVDKTIPPNFRRDPAGGNPNELNSGDFFQNQTIPPNFRRDPARGNPNKVNPVPGVDQMIPPNFRRDPARGNPNELNPVPGVDQTAAPNLRREPARGNPNKVNSGPGVDHTIPPNFRRDPARGNPNEANPVPGIDQTIPPKFANQTIPPVLSEEKDLKLVNQTTPASFDHSATAGATADSSYSNPTDRRDSTAPLLVRETHPIPLTVPINLLCERYTSLVQDNLWPGLRHQTGTFKKNVDTMLAALYAVFGPAGANCATEAFPMASSTV